MNNHELYPVYRSYVRMIWLWFLVFLPLCVGAAYVAFLVSGQRDAALLTFICCTVPMALYGVLRNQFLRCPHCGRNRVSLCGEPRNVLSMGRTLAPYEAYCRACGERMQTDLALKSNILFKSIPTQVTAEQLEKMRRDTF